MKILLVEPNYYTQYPPLGLLKLSTFYKQQGHEIRFVRGLVLVTGFYPDQVDVTSLFTWAWNPVWQCVEFYKALFPRAKVRLGGIYASLTPDHAKKCGADEVVSGLVPEVEDVLPDYSLVPEWHKKRRASVFFTHRGCVRTCGFCAVPKLEGKPFQARHSKSIRHLVHPEHTHAILWDNNILGEPHWRDVVEEIKALRLIVDFNQGLDARFINEDVARSLRGLRIPMIRVAYDYPKMGKAVKSAIDLLGSVGFSRKDMASYVLFNYRDTPEDLFLRVRDLLEWGVTAYPMRYQPLSGPNAFEKDSYISKGWTQEELDMVASARRVIGFGGALPAYKGLQNKFMNAGNFYEAFELRPHPTRPDKGRKGSWKQELSLMGKDHEYPTH